MECPVVGEYHVIVMPLYGRQRMTSNLTGDVNCLVGPRIDHWP